MPTSSATAPAAAVALDVGAATSGSCASYADSSDARSAGLGGGVGVEGAEKAFTTPTWASFTCGSDMNLLVCVKEEF